MDRRITLGVVVVLALLGGYIWYTFLRQDAPPLNPPTPEPTQVMFFTMERDKVQSIKITDGKTNQTTRVVRDGEKWKMEQPVQGEADSSRVDELFFDLVYITANRQLAAPSDLAPFGLNPPKSQVEIGIQDSSPVTISLGNENLDGDAVYAQKSGDASVYLIDSSLAELVQEFVTSPPYTPTPSATPPASATPQATPTP